MRDGGQFFADYTIQEKGESERIGGKELTLGGGME